MIHARKDYDRIQDPENKIPLDEPVFLLRGQDPFGWVMVLGWLKLYLEDPNHDPDVAVAVRIHALKMKAWAEKADHGLATVHVNQMRKW